MKKIIALIAFIGVFTFASAQSAYYNDYRSSITSVNWQSLVADLVLSPQQKDQLFSLNDRYPDYNSWDNHYRNNPDAWRTDRYSEMERILGTTKYNKFKNKYYKGQNPVAVYNRNKNNYKMKRKGKSYNNGNESGHGKKHGKGKH